MVLRGLTALLIGLTLAAAAPAPPKGADAWFDVAGGRIKTRRFTSPEASAHPVLVIVLHGDSPFEKPAYQYIFAGRVAGSGDVSAAGILRPGYTDAFNDTSSGQRGLTTGDNYTPDRLAMIAEAVKGLQKQADARATVLVGHSGGAAMAADLLALYPALAKGALLVSCPCDVPAWREHMKSGSPLAPWGRPVASLSPLALAAMVPATAHVAMIVGAADHTAPPRFTEAYAAALRSRGLKVAVQQLPGKHHDILLEPEVVAAAKAMAAGL